MLLKLKNLVFISLILLIASCSSIQAPLKQNDKVKILWSKRVTEQYLTGNLTYNKKAAHIDGLSKSVFTFVGENKFSSYDLISGKLNWTYSHDQRVVATPASSGTQVFYGLENGDFVARNSRTGKLKYKVALTSAINSKPIIEQGKVFLSLEEHGIVCLEEGSGELLWSYQRPLSKEVTLLKGSHPIINNETLITGFDDGAIVALNIFDGGIRWQNQVQRRGRFLDLDLKPLYAYRKLYIGGLKKSFIMDPKSGLILKSLNFGMSSNPVAYKDTVLYGKKSGHIEFMSSTGQQIKRIKVSNSALAYTGLLSPSQIIAISQDGRIKIFNADSLILQKTIELGHSQSTISDDISIDNGFAAIMSSRYRLYLIKSIGQ